MGQGISRKKYPDEESLVGMTKESESSTECNPEEESLVGMTKESESSAEHNPDMMIYIHKCGCHYKTNSSGDQFEAKWHNLLEDLAAKLLPDIEYFQRGVLMAGLVFSIIKYFREDVFRVKIGGSVGKRSGISTTCIETQRNELVFNSDFDLYVFLNNQKPPFGKIMEEFKMHIETMKDFLPQFCWIPKNENLEDISGNVCISFKIEGKAYHLYPAVNFVPILENGSFAKMDPFIQTFITESKHFVETQRLGTLREIQLLKNYRERILYFSSLEESCVRFFRNRPRFLRQVIRLLRYWNNNNLSTKIENNSRLKRRSALMDLCAMKATLITSSTNLYTILVKIMELLIDYQKLCIIFQMEEDKIVEHDRSRIVSIAGGKISILVDMPTTSNNEKDIYFSQETIIHSLPCVLDPCNPFNNLADFSPEEWDVLKNNASEAIIRLKDNRFQNEEMIHLTFDRKEFYV